MIVYVIQEILGNENSPDSLNVMVNYHYHSEKRVLPGNSHLCCSAGPTLKPSRPLWSQDFRLFEVVWMMILQPMGPNGVSV